MVSDRLWRMVFPKDSISEDEKIFLNVLLSFWFYQLFAGWKPSVSLLRTLGKHSVPHISHSHSFQLACFSLQPLLCWMLIQSLVQLNKYLLNIQVSVRLWGKYWDTKMRVTQPVSSQAPQSSGEDKWGNRCLHYIMRDSDGEIHSVVWEPIWIHGLCFSESLLFLAVPH